MLRGSIRIATLFGIDVRVHASWVLVAGLIFYFSFETFSLDLEVPLRDLITVSAIATLLFFSSVLLHELSHSVVARRLHLPVHSITLFLFGGVSNLRREPESARTEFLMASVGPLTSLVLAGVFYGLHRVSVGQLTTSPRLAVIAATLFMQLAIVNLLLGLFNLLPGFPLDGGRVLRSALWAIRRDKSWATRVAARGGQVVALALGVWGASQLVQPGAWFNGTWTMLIAFFLFNAASASYRQEQFDESLRRVDVASLMTRDLIPVPPELPVQGFVNMYVIPMRGRAFPVESMGAVQGIVSARDVRRLPPAEWPLRRVADIMSPLDRARPLRPQDDAQLGLERLLRDDLAHLPVVEDGKLLGLLERDVVYGYLRMREELGLDRRRR